MSRSKKPQTDPPERLSEIEKARIVRWCEKYHPKHRKNLGTLWASCRDWHLKRGEQAANWEAAFRSWIRVEGKIAARDAHGGGRFRTQVGTPEMPQDTGLRTPIHQACDIGPLFEEIKANGRK